MEPIIATVLVVAMVGGVGTWVAWDARKRKTATAPLVAPLAERGWTLTARGDQVAAGLQVAPFGAGSQRRCEDVIRSGDKAIVSFTYRWTAASGGHKRQHAKRVTMLMGGPKLPTVEVDAGTVPAAVRATDERVGAALVHPLMSERFTKPDVEGRSVFFARGRIGLVDDAVEIADIVILTDAAVATLRDIDALIPDSLRAEFS